MIERIARMLTKADEVLISLVGLSLMWFGGDLIRIRFGWICSCLGSVFG